VRRRLGMCFLSIVALGLLPGPAGSAAQAQSLAACVAPPPGMVGWWPGDGDASDIVGGNNGVMQNGAAFGAGEVRQAFRLDGINDYVEVANAAALNPGRITVDAWINPVAPQGTDYSPIVKKTGPGLVLGYALEFHGPGVMFWVYVNGAWRASALSGAVPTGQWTHVAGVYDGQAVRLYVNGAALGGGTAVAGSITAATNPLNIGRDPSNPTVRFYHGLIDEVEIFDRALSAAEVAAIYNAGSAGKCLPVSNSAPVAANDAYTTDEDTALSVAAPGVLGNDTDADANPLTAHVVSAPSSGTLALNPNGSFTYNPALNFNGTDSFTYKANDGTADSSEARVTISVAPRDEVVDVEILSLNLVSTNPIAGFQVDSFFDITYRIEFTARSASTPGALPVVVQPALTGALPADCSATYPPLGPVTLNVVGAASFVDATVHGVCGQPSNHSLTFTARLAPADPQHVDTDLANNTMSDTLSRPVIAQTDVAVQGMTLQPQPPQDAWAVDSFFDITYRIDLAGVSGFSPLQVQPSVSGVLPADCSATYPTLPAVMVSPGVASMVDATIRLRCTQPSNHDFTFTGRVVPVDLHVVDTNAANDQATARFSHAVIARTDVAVQSMTLQPLPPGEWAVDSFFDITYRIDLAGVSGFIPLQVQPSVSGVLPPDCSARYPALAPANVSSGAVTAVNATIGLRCTQPSNHDFTFTGRVVPVDPHVVDTNAANDQATASFSHAVRRLDTTPPEAYNQFDPVSGDLFLFGRDDSSGVPPGPVPPLAVVPGRGGRETRTYRVTDLAGNTLQVVEEVKREGHEIKGSIVSLQYNGGPVITAPQNEKKFEWAIDRDGTLRELKQKLEVDHGRDKQEVEARFDAKKNETTIKLAGPGPERRISRSGLVLLRLATINGRLVIEF